MVTYEMDYSTRVSVGISICEDGSMADLLKISTADNTLVLKGEEVEKIYEEYMKKKGG